MEGFSLRRYDPEPSIQKAAVQSLRHFGEPAAIDKLLHFARKNTEPLASVSIESLAASRFADARASHLKAVEVADSSRKLEAQLVLTEFDAERGDS